MEELTQFTYDDFADGLAPYEYVYQFENDRFRLTREIEKMSKIANAVKYRNFKKSYNDYVQKLKAESGVIYEDGTTQFEGQELELNSGQWRADEMGISKMGQFGEVFACVHPILPVLRLVNIDTNVEKLQLAYRKGKQWRHVIEDKRTLASSTNIIALADVGIAVNSENSRHLVQYLHDVETLNYDLIPEKNSVSRLGWIDGEGFSPYVESLIFDGADSFRGFFDSVAQRGSYEEWLKLAREIRQGSVFARIILAASFSSVLVKLIGELSFIVHLWGGTEAGKTVGLMFATSVWADPSMGKYIHTFNGTAVSQELSAGFVNNLPLVLDEFQMLKNKKDFETTVYMLCEGIGKGRGAKTGGIQKAQTWCNCTLTSGEMPITMQNSGGGAVNRIVEIECTDRLFDDPRRVADTVRRNYGHAGKQFVTLLQQDGSSEKARTLYKGFYEQIIGLERTEKQALAGAIILTADALTTEWIFQDKKALTVEDIREFLQSRAEVDANERAYNYICEYVVANANRFHDSDNGEIWGKFENNQVYIIRNTFGKICEEGGFSARAVLSWMMRRGLIETSIEPKSGKVLPTKVEKLNGACVRYVVMQLPQENDSNFSKLDDLDF